MTFFVGTEIPAAALLNMDEAVLGPGLAPELGEIGEAGEVDDGDPSAEVGSDWTGLAIVVVGSRRGGGGGGGGRGGLVVDVDEVLVVDDEMVSNCEIK